MPGSSTPKRSSTPIAVAPMRVAISMSVRSLMLGSASRSARISAMRSRSALLADESVPTPTRMPR